MIKIELCSLNALCYVNKFLNIAARTSTTMELPASLPCCLEPIPDSWIRSIFSSLTPISRNISLSVSLRMIGLPSLNPSNLKMPSDAEAVNVGDMSPPFPWTLPLLVLDFGNDESNNPPLFTSMNPFLVACLTSRMSSLGWSLRMQSILSALI